MFFFKLHRWLTFEGDTKWIGENAVALATIACIILTIGGVIVYWSRVKNNFLKSFTFSFKSKNRAFLSTMHSAIGMWIVPFSYLCVLQDFIGRMIGIEVQCLLLCKLNNQKELHQLLK